MNWILATNSSNIRRFAWRDGLLVVEFLDGQVYQYQGVPVEKFSALCSAPSKGSFFAREIRGRYGYSKQVLEVQGE